MEHDARRLLGSTVPARLAYTAVDGTPRVTPTWYPDGQRLRPTWVGVIDVGGRLPSARGGVGTPQDMR